MCIINAAHVNDLYMCTFCFEYYKATGRNGESAKLHQ